MSAAQSKASAVLARSGRTFHLASRLLPRRMRENATELYAFCRRMDDLADEAAGPEQSAEQSAEQGREQSRDQHQRVLRALREAPLGEDAAALGWPVMLEQQFPRISTVALRLTEALAADAGPCQMQNEAELYEYAFGVAGTVGLMMCRILGAPPEGAGAAADLGIAMQLTNIARDVQEDFGRGRIYLPAEWVTADEVRAALLGDAPEPLMRATERLLQAAEQRYRSAHAGMHYLPWRARVSILAAAACYREIGVVVGRDVPASWRVRAVVTPARKAMLIAQALRQTHRCRPGAMPVQAGGSHALETER